jgi:hypothetical protein
MDSTIEDEDPEDGKPNEEKPNENMDIDGKKDEDQAPNNESGNQLPNSGKAAGGAVQQEDASIDSLVHQSKPIQPSKKPVIVLSQNEVSPDGSGQWKANLMNPKNDSGLLNKMKVQNGGIVSPVRSSKRNVATVDQDSVEKATKLKARKNLEFVPDKGNEPQPCSFISRDDSSLLHTTKSLGVVLGDNKQDIFNSLKSLRDIEGHRMIESKKLVEENKVVVDDASTICSNDDI